MQYSKLIAAALCVAAQGSAVSADSSWDGFYAGISLDATRTNAGIAGTNAHDRKTQNGTLGAYAGFNRSTTGGLVWGGELAISPVESAANTSGGGLGSTEFNGRFMVTPRLRAGFTTGNLFVYGLAGAAISNAVVRPAGATSKDYAIGVSYGLGAELKLGNNWSTRVDITRTDLGLSDQNFGGITRDTKVKMDKISLGLSKKF